MLILHHYDMSPFSEKIRLMCGYAGLEWQSVTSREFPPRPNVDPLAGGYRRTPVAQVGADIFCDTHLISAELAHMVNRPELDPSADSAENADLAARAEGDLFFAAVACIPATRILRKLIVELSFTNALRFIRDRAGVAKTAVTRPAGPKRAVAMFREHLELLEQHLAGGGEFLAGAQPTHVDFATVHTLWFQHVVGGLPMPRGMPQLEHWYGRMIAFGHGDMHAATAEDGFAAARESEPRGVPEDMKSHEMIGRQVAIRPDDYAMDVTRGVLAGVSDTRWILAREAGELGALHVHFPRSGYLLE